ncbi:TPA: hypothetical protein L9K92_004992 [Klebsiella pneumoniae]|nr:hypothetical protein [Klebsiella pneumoniae]HBR1207892.1 hypothetical protein [Klebsiella pneumoniae]
MIDDTKKVDFIEGIPGASESREDFEKRFLEGMIIFKRFDSGAAIVIPSFAGASLSIGIVQEEKLV